MMTRMMTRIQNRIRAIANAGTSVGKVRYNLYRPAYARIKESIDLGFYLEAITLIESLVSDRLESRVSFLLEKDFSFKTLGCLIQKSSQIEHDEELKKLVSHDLDEWRRQRNNALHEMVKIDDRLTNNTWECRVQALPVVAKKGLEILRSIDSRCKILRRKTQSSPSI